MRTQNLARTSPIRVWRERRALSIAELALMAGTCRATLWRAEQGLSTPHPRTRRRIAAALGCSPAQIAPGEWAVGDDLAA
jgi:transcriptional regulator with XRE-family HTH domain